QQMQIGIDARLWGEPRSGIGRYTRSLVETLVSLAPEDRWVLYLDRPARELPPGAEARCLPWPQRLLWTLWAARATSPVGPSISSTAAPASSCRAGPARASSRPCTTSFPSASPGSYRGDTGWRSGPSWGARSGGPRG